MSNCNEETNNTIIELIKQKEENDRSLLMLEWVVGILSLIILFVPIIIGALLPMEEWQRLIIIFTGFIPAFIGFCFAVRIEQIAGYYECKHCHHRYVPSCKATILAMHMGRTRYMKCPECGKRSWQKKVISKE